MELKDKPDGTFDSSTALVAAEKSNAVQRAEKLADLKELALMSRDKLDANFDPVLDEIFASKKLSLKLAALQWLAERGFGKVPKVVRIDSDDDSLEGTMRLLAAGKLEQFQARQDAITTEIVEETNSEDNDNVRRETDD